MCWEINEEKMKAAEEKAQLICDRDAQLMAKEHEWLDRCAKENLRVSVVGCMSIVLHPVCRYEKLGSEKEAHAVAAANELRINQVNTELAASHTGLQ